MVKILIPDFNPGYACFARQMESLVYSTHPSYNNSDSNHVQSNPKFSLLPSPQCESSPHQTLPLLPIPPPKPRSGGRFPGYEHQCRRVRDSPADSPPVRDVFLAGIFTTPSEIPLCWVCDGCLLWDPPSRRCERCSPATPSYDLAAMYS